MDLNELIEQLIEIRDDNEGEEIEVNMAIQPNYPLSLKPRLVIDDDNNVWFIEDSQNGYASRELWEY